MSMLPTPLIARDHAPIAWSDPSIDIAAQGTVSQRIEFWREMILRLFADVQIAAVQQAGFFGQVRQRKCDKLRLSDIQASQQVVNRRHRQARSQDEDKYFAVLMIEGSQAVEQDGKIVTLHPGDFAVYDATRPHRLHFNEPWREIIVSVPRATLNQLVVGMESRTAMPINTSQGVGSVMRGFLVGMAEQVHHLSPDQMHQLSDTAITLMAMAMGELQRNDVVQSRMKALTLARVKRYLVESLQNAELSPLVVEQAVGMTSRYINKLFEAENTSLMRFVWALRLERCAEELANPHLSTLRVSDIAYRWSFNDMSHFSRAFKERFEMSPREWRSRGADR